MPEKIKNDLLDCDYEEAIKKILQELKLELFYGFGQIEDLIKKIEEYVEYKNKNAGKN